MGKWPIPCHVSIIIHHYIVRPGHCTWKIPNTIHTAACITQEWKNITVMKSRSSESSYTLMIMNHNKKYCWWFPSTKYKNRESISLFLKPARWKFEVAQILSLHTSKDRLTRWANQQTWNSKKRETPFFSPPLNTIILLLLLGLTGNTWTAFSTKSLPSSVLTTPFMFQHFTETKQKENKSRYQIYTIL